jgi:hypothetical protein
MDPGSAPQGVGEVRSAAAMSRLPSPERAKIGTMPPDDSLRFDDHQSIHNARRDPIATGKKEAIELLQASLCGKVTSPWPSGRHCNRTPARNGKCRSP